jgi:hypothetical protein
VNPHHIWSLLIDNILETIKLDCIENVVEEYLHENEVIESIDDREKRISLIVLDELIIHIQIEDNINDWTYDNTVSQGILSKDHMHEESNRYD